MKRRLMLEGNEGQYTCCIQPGDERRLILNQIYQDVIKRLGDKYGSYSFSAQINGAPCAVTLTQGPVAVSCRLVPVDSSTVITIAWLVFVDPHMVYATAVPDNFSYGDLLSAIGHQVGTSEHIVPAKNPIRARMFTILKPARAPHEPTTFDLDTNLFAICEYVVDHSEEFARSSLHNPVVTSYCDGQPWVLWGRVFDDGVWLFCHPSTKSYADPIFIPRHFDEKVSVRFPPNAPWKQIAALLAHVGEF